MALPVGIGLSRRVVRARECLWAGPNANAAPTEIGECRGIERTFDATVVVVARLHTHRSPSPRSPPARARVLIRDRDDERDIHRVSINEMTADFHRRAPMAGSSRSRLRVGSVARVAHGPMPSARPLAILPILLGSIATGSRSGHRPERSHPWICSQRLIATRLARATLTDPSRNRETRASASLGSDMRALSRSSLAVGRAAVVDCAPRRNAPAGAKAYANATSSRWCSFVVR